MGIHQPGWEALQLIVADRLGVALTLATKHSWPYLLSEPPFARRQ